MIEWEVWLDTGHRLTSQEVNWEDLPSGIQVVCWWDREKKQKGVHWGDSNYGLPGTWKGGLYIEIEDFERMLNEAQAAIKTPPSERK